MLLGICGKMAAGKSSLADFLMEKGFYQMSFAERLKIVASILELKNKQILRKIGCTTFREALQRLAHVFRDGMSEGFWIAQIEEDVVKMLSLGKDVVISDVRYLNEARWIYAMGGFIIYIDVSPEVAYKRIKNRKDVKDEDMSAIEFLQFSYHSSESECEIIGETTDHIIDGDKELKEFLIDADNILHIIRDTEKSNKENIENHYT